MQAITQVLASTSTNSWTPLGGMYVCGVLVGGGGGGVTSREARNYLQVHPIIIATLLQ